MLNSFIFLQLQKPIEFDKYHQKLDFPQDEPKPGEIITISGYGRIDVNFKKL